MSDCTFLTLGLADSQICWHGLGPRGLGFRVQGSGFRVQGLGFRV